MKKIEGYDNYYVTEDGDVYSTKPFGGNRGPRRLKPGVSSNGYLTVNLRRGGLPHSKTIHRLVAYAFISNPLNKKEVNHKNGNKLDNRAINLEWVTDSENKQHAYDELGKKGAWIGKTEYENPNSKEVVQMDLNGNEVAVYGSACEAARNGFNQGNISSCCLGVRKIHKGFLWKYK